MTDPVAVAPTSAIEAACWVTMVTPAPPTPLLPPAAGTAPAPQPTRGPADRIRGVDMARALAVIGMVMVHLGPFEPDTSDLLGTAYRSTYGRASVLFVLLAGVGISLLLRARPATQARIRLGWRVVVFFPVGVALQALPTPVAVILQFYAAYYLVGAAVGTLATRWLATLAAVWTVVGPLVFITFMDPDLAGRGTASTLGDPMGILADLLVTGFYPLLTWGPPLVVGLLVGRADLRDRATSAVLAGGGALVAAAAYGGSEIARAVLPATAADSAYLLAEGHTGAPLAVIGSTAVAVAVLGLCLLLAAALPRLMWPLVATGQMALTVYVIHILVLAVVPEWLEARDAVDAAVRSVSRFTVVTILCCVAWRARFSRGPLEALMVLPFRVLRPDRRLPEAT